MERISLLIQRMREFLTMFEQGNLPKDLLVKEINALTHVIDAILVSNGIASKEDDHTNTKSNADEKLQKQIMKHLVDDLELSAQDILLLARSQGSKATVLQDLSVLELFHVYKEAQGLEYEGLLHSYVYHLAMKAAEEAANEEAEDPTLDYPVAY